MATSRAQAEVAIEKSAVVPMVTQLVNVRAVMAVTTDMPMRTQ